MDITIHQAMLPHDDPKAALAFYRDTLGFEVRDDVGYEGMRWITVGPPSAGVQAAVEGGAGGAVGDEAVKGVVDRVDLGLAGGQVEVAQGVGQQAVASRWAARTR